MIFFVRKCFLLINRNVQEVLMYFFNLKKFGGEMHRLAPEAYSERSCEWFHKFKNDVDKERIIRSRNRKISVKRKENLRLHFRSESTSNFTLVRMIQNEGNLISYELKPRNIECRFYTSVILLAMHKRNDFLNCSHWWRKMDVLR